MKDNNLNMNIKADPDPKGPIIILLIESLNSLYQTNIWIGASDAANRLGYSLFCFAGGSLKKSSWDEYEPQRNIIYQFIDKRLIEGIIIAGSLGNFISSGEFEEFYKQFTDIPMVCLGPEISSVPTVIVDNTHGMRELISHLVEVHKCRRIAFVCGPEGNKEAGERLKIFKEVLKEHGVPLNSELIIEGDFSRDAGIRAVNYLLDRGLDFDALVGVNDDTALGALKTFQERHIRVPEEVLVAGFDDIEESGFSVPPLTTVRQPLYEMGGRAVEIIYNCIRSRSIKGTIIVPASLSTRQSCGCFRHPQTDKELFAGIGSEFNAENRLKLVNELEGIIARLILHTPEPFEDVFISDIVEAFKEEMSSPGKGRLISSINRLAWKLAVAGGDVMGLYQALSVMRKFALEINNGHLSEEIDSVFQNAYLTIADSATRAQANRRLNAERRASVLRAAGEAIASAFDLEKLLDVIARELVNLDIDECYLSLYDDSDEMHPKPFRLNPVLVLREGRRVPVEREKYSFYAPLLAPPEIMRMRGPRSLLVEPLFFRDHQIGIIIFGIQRCREGSTYEILRRHISSALKGALLMKKVREQSEALEAANLQLQKLRDAEHAYLEAIKHELELGREIQSGFLPRTIPQVPGWEIVAAFQPAREVSGDFYDVFTLPDGKVAMVICDVSGKDVSAALFMALIRTLIRAFAEQSISGATEPLDAVYLTNRYLIRHHQSSSNRYMYATLFMALLDPANGALQYVNAGHNPAALISAKSEISLWIGTTGPAIGIVPEAQYLKKSLTLKPHESFFLYTDGVTEAKSADGELFTKKRLQTLLSSPVTSVSELIYAIETAIRKHIGDQQPSDDITMLAVRNVADAG